MKQTIRFNTFETNSSSYHTLSIYRKSGVPKPQEIVKGYNIIINTEIPKKTIGYTDSYSYIGVTTYNKAQMVLRFMGYALERQLDELINEKDYTNEDGKWNWDRKRELEKEAFYKAPLIQAFVKAIKKYIGEDKDVFIAFTDTTSPYIDIVGDEDKTTSEIFGVKDEDLTNVDLMAERFYEIIFEADYIMEEVCESNE